MIRQNNSTAEFYISDFPRFHLNDPSKTVEGIHDYFRRWFRKWPSTANCSWLLPSLDEMSSFFLAHQLDMVDVFDALEKDGYSIFIYDFDNSVVIFRKAKPEPSAIELVKTNFMSKLYKLITVEQPISA